ANGLKEVWGADAPEMPTYRESLIETAVCINAAQTAFALRQEIELAGHWEIEVLFGVYNLLNHQVCMPNNPLAPASDQNVNLALPPSNPKEFHTLAVRMAEILLPMAHSSRSSSPLVAPSMAIQSAPPEEPEPIPIKSNSAKRDGKK